MLLTFTLYFDARPGCLIRSVKYVCKYRKYSVLTGVITSFTAWDLLQPNHQGWIGTPKTKSTCSPVLPWSLRSFFCFLLADFFFPSLPGACSQARTWRITRNYNVKVGAGKGKEVIDTEETFTSPGVPSPSLRKLGVWREQMVAELFTCALPFWNVFFGSNTEPCVLPLGRRDLGLFLWILWSSVGVQDKCK